MKKKEIVIRPAKQEILPNAFYTDVEAAPLIGLTNPKTLQIWRTSKRYPALRFVYSGNRPGLMGRDMLAFLQSGPHKPYDADARKKKAAEKPHGTTEPRSKAARR